MLPGISNGPVQFVLLIYAMTAVGAYPYARRADNFSFSPEINAPQMWFRILNLGLGIIGLATSFALTTCTKAGQNNGHEPGLRYDRALSQADSLLARGHFAESFSHNYALARQYPDSAAVDFRLFRVFMAVGMADEAIKVLQTSRSRPSAKAEPGFWSWPVSLSHIARGDAEALRKYTDTLLAIADTSQQAIYEQVAFNELFLYQYDSAIAHLERWVALEEPVSPPPNLGFLYLQTGATSRGLAILDIAEARASAAAGENPEDWEPYFELAEIASMRSDTASALHHLRLAMEKGLAREWWLMMEKGPDALPDPVFAPVLETAAYRQLMDPVFRERSKMRQAIKRSRYRR